MGNTSPTTSALTLHVSQETAAQGIPHNLSASLTKRTSLHIRCILTDPAAKRTFAVHVPPTGSNAVIIYDGPDAASPVLATAAKNAKWKHDFRVSLAALIEGQDTREELLRCTTVSKRKESYWFAMQLGNSVGRFEWRSTRAQGQGWGWKLVKDDEDIVAIFKSHRSLGRDKIGDLTFTGSGMSGQFGRQWEMMVLTTWACVWFKHI
ncbi:uncharacterized protein FPRO_15694 [Fusarium proliferatum ET1]|uniref:Uncharacterized protein n=1 Tax=Fusarium proliferatum (strain ET1) TaxID=1227346 RepID=A0A1L7VYU6_FUSPR|nr:uncharacterized protein FPRO_15694 [Fusarium proliferatum ET1]CZR45131.1 uncharacterized protein FPRO_15694 [Fusarium proliferatum ET1]